MNKAIIDTVFPPKPPRNEAKADATTRIAREIIDSEATAREAKTQRLRAARLAQEAAAKPATTTKKTRRKG